MSIEGTSADEALVRGVLAREPGAFERLVAAHQKLVWHVVFRLVQHPEDARELSQDVFLRAYQRLHQFRGESSLATWLGRIAFHVATRHLQRKRVPLVESEDEEGASVVEQVGDDFDLAAACADAELMARMGKELEALPPLQRTVMTLYYLDELGLSEIEQITGMPQGTIKSNLFRARLRLRDRLEDLMGACA